MAGEPTRCELCEAVPFTRQYSSDRICWVADCESCDVPMVVWREHATDPPDDVLEHLLGALRRAALQRFGDAVWSIDRVMRQIPDHFHAHARPRRW